MNHEGKVAIFSNDAGGAEILSSWIRARDHPFVVSLTGPAVEVFSRKIGYLKSLSIEEAIDQSDWVLTSTSWSSDLEYKAIKKAKELNKFVVTFLDHWVNYRERFNWHGSEILPDEIWVGDRDAYNLAIEVFPELNVRQLINPYWQDFKNDFQDLESIRDDGGIRILFASSNIDGIRKQQKDIKFSDDEILQNFLNKLSSLPFYEKIEKITIKTHPSELANKYEKFNFRNLHKKIILNSDKSNIFLINENTYIAGYESMLMVLASVCGKSTINIDMKLDRLQNIPKNYIDYRL